MKLAKALGALCIAFAVTALAAITPAATPATPATVTISVDATHAPRKIFHASLKIPATPGDLTLYYPKWIPGEHAPDGPVIDLAGLKFSAAGKTLKWRRDLLDGCGNVSGIGVGHRLHDDRGIAADRHAPDLHGAAEMALGSHATIVVQLQTGVGKRPALL